MLRLVLLVVACLFFIANGIGMSYKNLQFGWLGAACLTITLFMR